MINYSDFLNFVNQNLRLNVVPISLTLLGVFPAIVIYFKSKKSKQPVYCTRTVNLVKENINKIKSVDMLCHGVKINNLSVSKIAIWNAGKETINTVDIAKSNKFRIEIDEKYKILDYELVFQKNSANDFELTKISDNILEINFDYFDQHEGIIVQIYHTSTTGNSLNLKGSFKGVENIIRNDSGKRIFAIFDKIDKKLDLVFNYMLRKKILALFLFLFPVLFFILNVSIFNSTNAGKIVLVTLNVFFIIFYWILGYVVMKHRVPKGFDLFEEEF